MFLEGIRPVHIVQTKMKEEIRSTETKKNLFKKKNDKRKCINNIGNRIEDETS